MGPHPLRAAFDLAARGLGIRHWEDWYQVTRSGAGGEGLRKILHDHFGGSLVRGVQEVYPEHDWKPWLFQGHKLPKSYWEDKDNQRDLVEHIGKQLGVRSWEDWKLISRQSFQAHAGNNLLREYPGSSLVRILSELYPEEHNWNKLQYPLSHWLQISNHRRFFEELGRKLNIKRWQDWYEVDIAKEMKRSGGDGLLQSYGGSAIEAIIISFPEHCWKVWLFVHNKVPEGFWEEENNVSEYVRWLEKEFEIKHYTDWFSVTSKKINEKGGATLLHKRGSLMNILPEMFPQYDWRQSWNRRELIVSKSQKALFQVVQEIFPKADIYHGYPHPNLKYSSSNKTMEFDIFIPLYQLAFEFQGEHHYGRELTLATSETSHIGSDIGSSMQFYEGAASDGSQMLRDAEKKEACKASGVTLIEVPYWWDKKKESLVATIRKFRPDLSKEMQET
eukprot:TRINITY_DN10288_c0_g1_i1.p1 TRINITY_DN10288_c0_g1~~TRINITY_DN10288_c0_g1_i1.p1  ORF type:complete len:454 (-),score=83.12 TRINITY_DN10288_c0_g1_i1:73-1410(-)